MNKDERILNDIESMAIFAEYENCEGRYGDGRWRKLHDKLKYKKNTICYLDIVNWNESLKMTENTKEKRILIRALKLMRKN